MRFNTACLKKFGDEEYVELLLNTVERCIAIRPCSKDNPNAIRWGRLKDSRWSVSDISCRGLAKTLFDIMEWDEDTRYRFRGEYVGAGENNMLLFKLDEPEMIKTEEITLPPQEPAQDGTEQEEIIIKKKMMVPKLQMEEYCGCRILGRSIAHDSRRQACAYPQKGQGQNASCSD